eukprot:g12910.t1
MNTAAAAVTPVIPPRNSGVPEGRACTPDVTSQGSARGENKPAAYSFRASAAAAAPSCRGRGHMMPPAPQQGQAQVVTPRLGFPNPAPKQFGALFNVNYPSLVPAAAPAGGQGQQQQQQEQVSCNYSVQTLSPSGHREKDSSAEPRNPDQDQDHLGEEEEEAFPSHEYQEEYEYQQEEQPQKLPRAASLTVNESLPAKTNHRERSVSRKLQQGFLPPTTHTNNFCLPAAFSVPVPPPAGAAGVKGGQSMGRLGCFSSSGDRRFLGPTFYGSTRPENQSLPPAAVVSGCGEKSAQPASPGSRLRGCFTVNPPKQLPQDDNHPPLTAEDSSPESSVHLEEPNANMHPVPGTKSSAANARANPRSTKTGLNYRLPWRTHMMRGGGPGGGPGSAEEPRPNIPGANLLQMPLLANRLQLFRPSPSAEPNGAGEPVATGTGLEFEDGTGRGTTGRRPAGLLMPNLVKLIASRPGRFASPSAGRSPTEFGVPAVAPPAAPALSQQSSAAKNRFPKHCSPTEIQTPSVNSQIASQSQQSGDTNTATRYRQLQEEGGNCLRNPMAFALKYGAATAPETARPWFEGKSRGSLHGRLQDLEEERKELLTAFLNHQDQESQGTGGGSGAANQSVACEEGEANGTPRGEQMSLDLERALEVNASEIVRLKYELNRRDTNYSDELRAPPSTNSAGRQQFSPRSPFASCSGSTSAGPTSGAPTAAPSTVVTPFFVETTTSGGYNYGRDEEGGRDPSQTAIEEWKQKLDRVRVMIGDGGQEMSEYNRELEDVPAGAADAAEDLDLQAVGVGDDEFYGREYGCDDEAIPGRLNLGLVPSSAQQQRHNVQPPSAQQQRHNLQPPSAQQQEGPAAAVEKKEQSEDGLLKIRFRERMKQIEGRLIQITGEPLRPGCLSDEKRSMKESILRSLENVAKIRRRVEQIAAIEEKTETALHFLEVEAGPDVLEARRREVMFGALEAAARRPQDEYLSVLGRATAGRGEERRVEHQPPTLQEEEKPKPSAERSQLDDMLAAARKLKEKVNQAG